MVFLFVISVLVAGTDQRDGGFSSNLHVGHAGGRYSSLGILKRMGRVLALRLELFTGLRPGRPRPRLRLRPGLGCAPSGQHLRL